MFEHQNKYKAKWEYPGDMKGGGGTNINNLNGNFHSGWGGLKQHVRKLSVGGVWTFSGITQSLIPNMREIQVNAKIMSQ